VTPATPFSEVLEHFEKYHLRTLCVTDEFDVLVGLISIEDVLKRLASAR
jgi:CBS domain containing-hemolysin-like protein